jgi:hypothetical protein
MNGLGSAAILLDLRRGAEGWRGGLTCNCERQRRCVQKTQSQRVQRRSPARRGQNALHRAMPDIQAAGARGECTAGPSERVVSFARRRVPARRDAPFSGIAEAVQLRVLCFEILVKNGLVMRDALRDGNFRSVLARRWRAQRCAPLRTAGAGAGAARRASRSTGRSALPQRPRPVGRQVCGRVAARAPQGALNRRCGPVWARRPSRPSAQCPLVTTPCAPPPTHVVITN